MSFYSIYFSPTGGTKKAADRVCQTLFQGQEIVQIDLSQPEEDFSKYQFEEEDVCVVAMPSFGGRVPAIASQRLSQMTAKKAKAVLMAVYGNREFEDTLAEMEDVLSEAGFECAAAVSAIAEHSIVGQYGAGRPDEKDQAQLAEFGETIKAHLAAEKSRKQELTGQEHTDWIPGNRPYKKLGVVPMKPQTDDDCLKCGTCAAKCPVQAISRTDPKVTDETACITCMRCVQICPKHARKLGTLVTLAIRQKLKKVCTDRKNAEFVL